MSNPVDAFIPFWIADYLADTMHLTTLQHGAYFLLLLTYWRRGGPLPDDDKQLAAITKMSVKEWRKIRPIMMSFFSIKNRVWIQKRCEEELAIAKENREKALNRTAAATEARKTGPKKPARRVKTGTYGHRADERNDASDENRDDERDDAKTPQKTPEKDNVTSTTSPSPSPITSPSEKKPKPPKKPKAPVEPKFDTKASTVEFEQAWDAYPTVEGESKHLARIQWGKLDAAGERPPIDKMLAAIMGYRAVLAKANKNRKPGEHTQPCHFVTFLAQRRFETLIDDPAAKERKHAEAKAALKAQVQSANLEGDWLAVRDRFSEAHGEDAWVSFMAPNPKLMGGGDEQLVAEFSNTFFRDQANEKWGAKLRAVSPPDNPILIKARR